MKTYKPLNGKHVIFSDLQGNVYGLKRFIESTKNMFKDSYAFLGDIVQHNHPSANMCIEGIKEIAEYAVKGNHEEELIQKKNEAGKTVYPYNIDYIEKLPTVIDLGNTVMYHSSLKTPNLRLRTEQEISDEINHIHNTYPNKTKVFFGHSHKKGVYTLKNGNLKIQAGKHIQTNPFELALINPGGIGLKDGSEQTFALFNSEKNEVHFFSLEEAEKMSYLAEVVNSFDSRWMPSLNKESIGWFLNYIQNDIPSLKEAGEQEPLLLELADTLGSLNKREANSQSYLKDFSYELALKTENIRKNIKEFYETRSPLESRMQFMLSKKDEEFRI